ncbi:hypothetical protein KDW40_07970 [Burkholderia cenocepacia]|uniref:hypothetical protein n=1 Tax=Burkholderia cepacia complex TaxID=87882 RepID=UPI001B9B2D0A|nr:MULTISPECIES: hypothetical protein [Burkholderia cepacia complex]MBR8037890.1 hypothetical protein [Burkholderia cenocepacia]MBR8325671.1 hypothetical protein [Burkholderia cenocepacia]MDN7581835.1 hypothetical protein [Burkholderia orbicola]
MKKFFWIDASRDTAAGISGLILGLSIACLLSHLPGSSSEWASWVQAIGSIGAIIGAYFFGKWQAHAAEEQASRAREDVLKGKQLAARTVADAAFNEVKAASKAIGDSYLMWGAFHFHYRPGVFSAQIDAIGRLKLFELDDAEAMRSIIGLHNSMLAMQHIFSRAEKIRAEYRGNPPGDGISSNELIGYVTAAFDSYVRIRNRFHDNVSPMEAIEHPRARGQ